MAETPEGAVNIDREVFVPVPHIALEVSRGDLSSPSVFRILHEMPRDQAVRYLELVAARKMSVMSGPLVLNVPVWRLFDQKTQDEAITALGELGHNDIQSAIRTLRAMKTEANLRGIGLAIQEIAQNLRPARDFQSPSSFTFVETRLKPTFELTIIKKKDRAPLVREAERSGALSFYHLAKLTLERSVLGKKQPSPRDRDLLWTMESRARDARTPPRPPGQARAHLFL